MSDLFKRTGSADFSKFLKVMVSGPPKSGKTTLLGTVPNILVLDTEPHANNLESIAHKDVPYVTITNSDDLRQVAMILSNDSLRKQLAQNTYGMPDIGAVAIDTLDTLQKILKAERMKEQRTTQFLRDDWGWLKTEMEKIVEIFTALPMHVFFMVHTKTQEMGKGDDSYTTVLPGLEGAIAQSIAGMVGYSLLSFRKEEIAADGTVYTKYWLRTEGDRVHEFLGTRTAGKLPTIIEPDMATIYNTVMANRPKPTPAAPAATASAPAPAASQGGSEQGNGAYESEAPGAATPAEPAQNAGQAQEVQTPVQTPEPAAAEQAATPPAALPADEEAVSPAAIGHVKRVYDSIGVPLTDDVTAKLNMGDARNIVRFWRAVMEDHKGDADQTAAQQEMREILASYQWLPATPAAPAQEVEAKVDGTIPEVMAYVAALGDGPDLGRVQEAYEIEMAKGDGARKSLVDKLESLGAKPPAPAAEEVSTPAEEVQTGGETQDEAVTPSEPAADTPATEEEALAAAKEGLNAQVVDVIDGIPEGSPCDGCGNPIDDLDLAELGHKRFGKVLCVQDYLAEMKK